MNEIDPGASSATVPYPESALTLKALLVVHGVLSVLVGFPLWLLTLAFSAMVGDSGQSAAVLFLALFGPSAPLNLLAAYNFNRHPRKARVYLLMAGVVAVLQALALTLYAIGLIAVPMILCGAVLVAGVVIAGFVLGSKAEVQLWLTRGEGSGTKKRFKSAAADLAVLLGTVTAIASVLALIWSFILFPGQRGDHDFDESEAWSKLEDAAADVIPVFAGFDGFRSRTLEVDQCGGEFRGGGEYFRYELSYEFSDAVQADAAVRSEYRLAARDYWLGEGYEAQFDRQTQNGDWSIVVHDDEDLRLAVYEGLGADDPIELNLQTGCVERVGTPPCLDPQGGVPPEADRITGIRCEE
jgi:hypothetical protein